MILIVTNKEDLTVDYVIIELTKRGIPFFRFNTEDFPTKIFITFKHAGHEISVDIWNKYKRIDLKEIKAAWYRRPGMPIISSAIYDNEYRSYATIESVAVLQSLYRLLGYKWLNHPLDIAAAESKPYQLVLAKEIGFNIPRTLITTSPNDLLCFYKLCNNRVIVKPLKQATLRGINEELVVFTSQVTTDDLKDVESIRYSPCIYQEHIEKEIDIRVTIVGNNIFAVGINSQLYEETQVDWRQGERIDLPHEIYILPKDIQDKCFSIVRKFNLKFGAIDIVLAKDGNFYFLEINPNGQWAWMEERLDLKISEAIVDVMIEGKYEVTI